MVRGFEQIVWTGRNVGVVSCCDSEIIADPVCAKVKTSYNCDALSIPRPRQPSTNGVDGRNRAKILSHSQSGLARSNKPRLYCHSLTGPIGLGQHA